jgi:hypothetical protein
MDFVLEEVELDKCLIAKRNMGWLWHSRLAHIGMRNLHKLQKEGHIIGLTNIVFEKDRPSRACQAGKQVGAPHHAKNIMTTTRSLEMFHIDNGSEFKNTQVEDYLDQEGIKHEFSAPYTP